MERGTKDVYINIAESVVYELEEKSEDVERLTNYSDYSRRSTILRVVTRATQAIILTSH